MSNTGVNDNTSRSYGDISIGNTVIPFDAAIAMICPALRTLDQVHVVRPMSSKIGDITEFLADRTKGTFHTW